MRGEKLDNVARIEQLTRHIADLEDVIKICKSEAHRASRENGELKEKIARLESELKSAIGGAKNPQKPELAARPRSSDLLYFLEAASVSRGIKQDRAKQKTASSNPAEIPILSELWSEATDVPISKKRAKPDNHASDAGDKTNSPG